MRECPVDNITNRPSQRYIDFRAKVEEVDYLSTLARHRRNWFLEYDLGHANTQSVYETLSSILSPLECHLCVGTLVDPDTQETNILIYMRKQSHRALPNLAIEGKQPTSYCPCEHFKAPGIASAIQSFSSVVSSVITAIVVEKPRDGDNNFSFHQLLHETQTMSKLDLAMVKGQIKSKKKADLTDFDQQFLKVLPTVMEIRKINDESQGSLMFNAYDPPFNVCPLSDLINLHQEGTRLKEVVMTDETFNLKDPLRRASIMSNYSVILLGNSTTTGFGKTQYTLRLAIEWAKAYSEYHRLPKESAIVYLSSTIDPAKNVHFKPGMVWILDEFHPYDSHQLVHCSETMLKVLLSPQMNGTVRGRNDDVKLVSGVARIISANSNSPEAWCGTSSKWSEPLRRKSICFTITEPLCSESWRARSGVEAMRVDAGFDAILANNTRVIH